MSRRFDSPARLHVEATQRLLSLVVAVLAVFVVSCALYRVPWLPERQGGDVGAMSLDLSFGEQRQLLDEALARAAALHAR